jgi:hypothetical protein
MGRACLFENSQDLGPARILVELVEVELKILLNALLRVCLKLFVPV